MNLLQHVEKLREGLKSMPSTDMGWYATRAGFARVIGTNNPILEFNAKFRHWSDTVVTLLIFNGVIHEQFCKLVSDIKSAHDILQSGNPSSYARLEELIEVAIAELDSEIENNRERNKSEERRHKDIINQGSDILWWAKAAAWLAFLTLGLMLVEWAFPSWHPSVVEADKTSKEPQPTLLQTPASITPTPIPSTPQPDTLSKPALGLPVSPPPASTSDAEKGD